MKSARWWAIAGLVGVCGGVFGCAQLPSRGLFSRRPEPPTANAARAEESSDDSATDVDHDLADGNSITTGSQASEQGSDSAQERLSGDRTESAAAGGLFDVSSRVSASNTPDVVEAPPPIRRTTGAPATFIAPPNIREMTSNSSSSSTSFAEDRDGVVAASYEATSHPGIELAAAQRRATSGSVETPNPWNRFRDLTNVLDEASTSAAQGIPPQGSRNALTDNDVTPQEARNVVQIQSWPDAFSPGTPSNRLDGSTHNPNSPEPWPRAPGTSGFTPNSNFAPSHDGRALSERGNTTPTPLVPPQVQRVHAEQLGSLNFPSEALASQATPTGTLPLNLGSPEGSPIAIAPFASSQELERLITQTTVEAAAVTPGDNEASRQLYLRKHVQLRLLLLIAGQTDRALQPIPGIDSADQEFWQQVLWGMANYFDTQGMPEPSERATQTISQLRTAAAKLQEKARLELHNVAFCHKISGFGNYQRFKRDEFTPGQQVLLYAEVADFKSEQTSDGQFRTLMKSTLDIIEGGSTGRLVESLSLSATEDHCRNQRRDYYHSYDFSIPQNCNPGPHTLLLRVEDQLGKKTAVARLNFTVQ